MPEVISDSERELAKKVANLAMIAGWDQAIGVFTKEYGISDLQIRTLLKKAADYNDVADPKGRIPELEDYKKELQGRSERSAKSQGRFNPRAKAPEGSSLISGLSHASSDKT